jgi:MATE family multidrug resistance protein
MSFRVELRSLVRLAAPLAAAQAGTQLMSLVDLAVVGRLGARELAAAGLGNTIFFAVSVIGMGLVFGVDPMISHALGARDPVRARHVFWQGAWVAVGATVVLTIPLLLAPYVMPHFHMEAETQRLTILFVVVRTLGLAPLLLFLVVRSYLQALNVTRPLVYAMLAGNVVNLILDIVLVFGWRFIPPLGVVGAAISTDIGALLQLWIVAECVRRIDVKASSRMNWPEIAQAVRVGLPVGLQMGAELGVFAFVGVLAGRMSALDLAAHQLVLGLASFTFTIALGISAAGSVRVGLAVGARDRQATRTAGFAALTVGTTWMLIAASIFALAPRAVARLVTDQPSVIAAAIPLLVVAAFFQISDGVQVVGAGVLRGAGDTKVTFFANVLGHWLIGLPIAFYLGFHRQMGIVGLWWGLCVGLTAVALLLFLRFNRMSKREIAPIVGRT